MRNKTWVDRVSDILFIVVIWVFIATILILAVGAIVSCCTRQDSELPYIENSRFEIIEDVGMYEDDNLYIIQDRDTGEKYIIVLSYGGVEAISPLLEPKVQPQQVESTPEPTPVSEPKIDIPIDQYEDVARYLAKTIYGEARGCSTTQQAAVIWCILNRVDTDCKYSPKEVIQVITAKSQFHGYDPDHPVLDEHYNLAIDVLTRWLKEKAGETNVGRVLPKQYLYFGGDGVKNTFRDSWKGGNRWNWSLPSPYEV